MSVTMEVKFFNAKVLKDLYELERPTISRVLKSIQLLKDFGATLRMPHSKKIASELFELRIKGMESVRIIYTFKNNCAVLLLLFVKKTQKTPPSIVQIAKRRLESID